MSALDDRAKELWAESQRLQRLKASIDRLHEQHGGGGGGGSGSGGERDVGQVTLREYVDKADEAIESRLLAKLDTLPSKGQMWGMVAATLGGMFTIVVGALSAVAFAGDRFDAGLDMSPQLATYKDDQATVDARQNAEIEVMNDKLDVIIKQTARD